MTKVTIGSITKLTYLLESTQYWYRTREKNSNVCPEDKKLLHRVTDPFSSLGTFSSFSIGGPVFHVIDDCEHPFLYLPGTGIASQEIAISGFCQFLQNTVITRDINFKIIYKHILSCACYKV
jgi:hypothetical protein